MFKGFNFSNQDDKCNCPECRMGGVLDNQAEVTSVDLSFVDPEDVLEQYFEEIKQVDNEEELFDLLVEFMQDVSQNAVKEYVLGDITNKIEEIQGMEIEDEDSYL